MRIGSMLTPKLVAGEAGTSFGFTALFLVSLSTRQRIREGAEFQLNISGENFHIHIVSNAVKYWEIIADNLNKAGWSWGCVSAINSNGQTIWIVDAHRDDGKRFVVRG